MKKTWTTIIIMVITVICGQALRAATIGFESSEGYSTGSIHGQPTGQPSGNAVWSDTSGDANMVTTADAYSGSQAFLMPANTNQGVSELIITNVTDDAVTHFSTWIKIDSTSSGIANFYLYYSGGNERFFFQQWGAGEQKIGRTVAGANQVITSNCVYGANGYWNSGFWAPGKWFRIDVDFDFSDDTYDIRLHGEIPDSSLENIPMSTSAVDDRLTKAWCYSYHETVDSYIDDITLGDGAGYTTVHAAKDSYIAKNNSTTNYGDADAVMVHGSTSVYGKFYVGYDLPAIDGVVTSAVVDVTMKYENFSSDVNTVKVYGLNDSFDRDDWGEMSVTWENAPANTNMINHDLTSDATLLGEISITNGLPFGSTIRFDDPDLTTFINDDSDGKITLIGTTHSLNDASTAIIFTSKDHGMYPGPTLYLWTRPHQGTVISVQ